MQSQSAGYQWHLFLAEAEQLTEKERKLIWSCWMPSYLPPSLLRLKALSKCQLLSPGEMSSDKDKCWPLQRKCLLPEEGIFFHIVNSFSEVLILAILLRDTEHQTMTHTWSLLSRILGSPDSKMRCVDQWQRRESSTCWYEADSRPEFDKGSSFLQKLVSLVLGGGISGDFHGLLLDHIWRWL